MGSVAAMEQGSKDRYFQSDVENRKLVPEGIEGRVPWSGLASDVLFQLTGGVKSGLAYSGARDIAEFRSTAEMIQVTAASVIESHPHNVSVIREAPNYSR